MADDSHSKDEDDWQRSLAQWAEDHLPSASAECISLWSDSIAGFIVQHIAEIKGDRHETQRPR